MIDALIGGGIACKYFVKTLSYFWEQILVEVGIFLIIEECSTKTSNQLQFSVPLNSLITRTPSSYQMLFESIPCSSLRASVTIIQFDFNQSHTRWYTLHTALRPPASFCDTHATFIKPI